DPQHLVAAQVRDRKQVATAERGRFAGDVHPLTLAAAAARRDPTSVPARTVTLRPEFLVERPGSPFLHHETVTPSHDFTTEAPETAAPGTSIVTDSPGFDPNRAQTGRSTPKP